MDASSLPPPRLSVTTVYSPEHLDLITTLYRLLCEQELYTNELERLNNEVEALLAKPNAAELASTDLQQYYAWMVLSLIRINNEIAQTLEALKERNRLLPPSLGGATLDGSSFDSLETNTTFEVLFQLRSTIKFN